MNVTAVAAWQLHYAVNQRPLSDLEFRREIAVAYMKTPLGFTLRRHLYGGPTADLPANNCFDGIDYPRFQPQKGDAESARKMLDTCAVNVVFVCIAIRVLCVLICTILTNDEVFSCKVLQNWIFYEA